MSGDEEDLVIYGSPIEREEEITTRKKKAVAEASGHLRTALPPWKQEVTDEEWRSRFHEDFTGEYSAGYHNTVGSKEGWTPQSFTSSRNKRAEVQQQNIFNFLDEDEKAELEGRTLAASMQFDTFGFTAVELARKQADKEKQERPSAIPGPVPDELIAPFKESIVAPCQARKGFLARSRDDGSEIAHSNINEEDSENVPDLSEDDDNQFTKSTPPPPAPHLRSKMDSLMLMPDSIVASNVEENVSVAQASSLNPQVNNRKQDGGNEAEDEVEVENVERPVDLYKAIFSDDEDDEEENNTTNQVEETKIEVVNTTLNRLIAGDFLESLGKELGLSLPPEMPLPVAHKEATKGDQEKTESSRNGGSAGKKSNDTRYIQEYPSNDVKFPRDRGSVEDDRKENRASEVLHNERYPSCHKTHNWSSSSSGDEKRDMKCSRSRRRRSTRSSSLDSDSSNHSDIRDQHRRSRRDDKGSYQEKSSSRKHSKHRKHRRKDSPGRSHRSSELDERKRKNEYGE